MFTKFRKNGRTLHFIQWLWILLFLIILSTVGCFCLTNDVIYRANTRNGNKVNTAIGKYIWGGRASAKIFKNPNGGADVEQLRKQIKPTTKDSTEIENGSSSLQPVIKKYLFVMDSYGAVLDDNFVTKACNSLGLVNGTDYFIVQKNGSGFNPTTTEVTFRDLISDWSGDKNSITDIYTVGGANDQNGQTYDSINNNIKAFIDYAKQVYPNAKVKVGFFSKKFNSPYYANAYVTLCAYANCVEYGGQFIENSQCVMNDITLFNEDMVHPISEGTDELAKHLVTAILYNRCDVQRLTPYTWTSTWTDGEITNYSQYMCQNNMNLYFKSSGIYNQIMAIQYGAGKQPTTSRIKLDNVATVNTGFTTAPSSGLDKAIPITCRILTTQNTQFTANGELTISSVNNRTIDVSIDIVLPSELTVDTVNIYSNSLFNIF